MNFATFKKTLFHGRTNKKEFIKRIKVINSDFEALNKFINRFDTEIRALKGLLNNVLLGNNPFPKTYEELNVGGSQFLAENIEQEMNWQILSILRCADTINLFNKLSLEFESYLLLGKYDLARKILDKIENEICISYWSIEYRFILDEHQFGTERNWETRNLVLEEKNHPFVQALGNFFSLKAEKKVSFFQYIDEYSNWEKGEGLDQKEYEGFSDYFRFKANFFTFSEFRVLKDILHYDSNASIIDKYLSFIKLSQYCVSKDIHDSNLLKLLNLLNNHITDNSIKQLLNFRIANFDVNSNENESIIKILDEYTKGNYKATRDLVTKLTLTSSFNYIELLEIYAKSIIEENLEYIPIGSSESFINQIARNYYNILQKNGDTDNSLVNLLKLAYVFSNNHIGNCLYQFVSQQLNWQNEINYSFLGNLSSRFFNPRIVTNLQPEPEILPVLVDNLNKTYPNSITVKAFLLCYNCNIDNSIEWSSLEIPDIKKSKYQLISFYNSGNYSDCIIHSNNLLGNNKLSIISEYEVISLLFACYIHTNDNRSAVKLYVDYYLKNSFLTKKMNADDLLGSILKSKFKNIGDKSDLIELPIFLRICNAERIKLKQSYELFLSSNNANRPSEMFEKKLNVHKHQYIYFLSKVCTTDTLQLSKYFCSSYEVNEERIIILKHLSKIDSNDTKLYKEELAELTQKNTISKVIGGIDERKIFVNESKIRQIIINSNKENILQKSKISPLTEESFQRYVELLEFVKNNNEFKDVSSIMQFGDDGELTIIEAEKDRVYQEGDGDVDVVLYMPVFKIFTTYFLSIRDLFIFSKEFGLNAYLSTRIRHGTLPNHLRSVFESYSLVTAQTDNVYAENQTWNEKLELSSHDTLILQNILSDFSAKIDNFSRQIKDNFIQCKDEKNEENNDALFDYTYQEQDLIFLFLEEFEGIKTIEDFIDKSFQILWERTEIILSEIRNKFDYDYRDTYIAFLDDLQLQLNTKLDNGIIVELLNNIKTCSTEIQMKLSNISKWFRRAESSFDGDYELSILAETSVQITQNLNPNYKIEVIKDISPSFNIIGDYHQHIIDLINNCMFNIVKHAHSPCNKLNAKMSIKEINEMLVFDFENSVSEESAKEHSLKLSTIKSNWLKPDSNISKEDGTGFPKIKKIIHSDLNRKSSSFNFTVNENRLNVILSFEKEGLKV